MPPDESGTPVDTLQQQLRSVIDAQLAAFSIQYTAALEDARQRVRDEAERVFTQRIDALREEWSARLDTQTRALRAEADHRVAEATTSVRAAAERRTEEAVAQARAEGEQEAATRLEHARAEAHRRTEESVAHARAEAERTHLELLTRARAEIAGTAAITIAEARAEADARATDAIAQARAEIERASADAVAQARAEADARATDAIAQARAEAGTRTDEAIAEARADADRSAAEMIAQARIEAERHHAETLARTREELERTLAAERIRAEHAIADERERSESALEAREVEAATARQTVRAVIAAIRALDHSTSLTHALETLTEHAAAVAGRAAVFVLSGDRLSSFRTAGFPSTNGSPYETSLDGTGLLSLAVRSREMQTSGTDVPPPAFAAIGPEQAAIAVPLSVGERVVAVLYVDAAVNVLEVYGSKAYSHLSSRDWTDAVDAMARHASLVLGAVTAARTVQAVAPRNVDLPAITAPRAERAEEEQRARRYARLLLSEIKLYNESAIRLGRQQRDLLRRLRPEIDRARRLYEERVPSNIGGRAMYFQQELVQALADGDAALLGTAV
jgi:chemotaxis protein histidine kinase CheA